MNTRSETITIRTYENFRIRWDRGSTWSGYDTAEQAQHVIDYATSDGHVERHEWDAVIRPEHLHLYQPGIAERTYTHCLDCGTNGDHYCPSSVCRPTCDDLDVCLLPEDPDHECPLVAS